MFSPKFVVGVRHFSIAWALTDATTPIRGKHGDISNVPQNISIRGFAGCSLSAYLGRNYNWRWVYVLSYMS